MISKLPIIATIILRVVTGGGSQIPGGDQIPGGAQSSNPPGFSNLLVAPSGDLIILIFSFIIWIFSLFLFFEAIKTQKHFSSEERNESWSKVLALGISFGIIMIWMGRINGIFFPFLENYGLTAEVFYLHPKEYAPGFLLASLLPTSIGLLKLLTVIAKPQIETPRILVIVLVKIIFSLLTAAASIVTLVNFFHP